jgi:hypothetical protein
MLATIDGVGESRVLSRHQREVRQSDRRWLAIWLASFASSLLGVGMAYALYKATGPHPQVTLLLRQLRHEVRWLIPGLKGKPNAKNESVGLEWSHRRYALLTPASGTLRTATGRHPDDGVPYNPPRAAGDTPTTAAAP